MRILTQLVRVFVGVVFIISGLVKTIDPIGFSYKLEEYFSPQVFDMTSFMDLALPLSILFVVFEVVLGVMLLLGVWRRFTLSWLLLLIVAFSFLTFYSAYYNKVTDCGCFGDAIKFTPWQSFGKDLILLILILFLWFNKKYITRFIARPYTYIFIGFTLAYCSYLVYQGIYYLPVKDFRPYAIGKSIPEGMKTAEELGKEPTIIEIEYHLKNKLNKKKIKVTEQEYIANKEYWKKGSAWELLESKDKIIKKGYEPPIHDFYVDCMETGDETQNILSAPSVILVITSLPFKAEEKGIIKMRAWVSKAKDLGIPMYNLSSGDVEMGDIPNCLMDATALKTIIRSNPGVIILQKGVVVGKYSWRDLPTKDEIKKILN